VWRSEVTDLPGVIQLSVDFMSLPVLSQQHRLGSATAVKYDVTVIPNTLDGNNEVFEKGTCHSAATTL